MIVSLILICISLGNSQYESCCCPCCTPLCATFFPSQQFSPNTFGFPGMSFPLSGCVSPFSSCYPLSGVRSVPLQSLPIDMDMETLAADVIEYKDQTNVIGEMVNGQDFHSLSKDSLDALLGVYGGLYYCSRKSLFTIFLFWFRQGQTIK